MFTKEKVLKYRRKQGGHRKNTKYELVQIIRGKSFIKEWHRKFYKIRIIKKSIKFYEYIKAQ